MIHLKNEPDTVVVLDKYQIQALNHLWVDYNDLIKENTELSFNFNKLIELDTHIIDSFSKLVPIKDLRIKNRDNIIIEYKDNEKITNRKIKILKTKNSIIGSAFTAALLYIVYDLIKQK